MTLQEIENLYIRSLDEPMNDIDRQNLATALKENPGLINDLGKYNKIRELTLRKVPASFGPYFARKVVARIQNVGIQIDREILAYFKKYQLAAVGVVMALVALNAIFADQLDLPSIFGLQDSVQPTEEIVSFDFSDLTNK
jgi:hypothetical protein